MAAPGASLVQDPVLRGASFLSRHTLSAQRLTKCDRLLTSHLQPIRRPKIPYLVGMNQMRVRGAIIHFPSQFPFTPETGGDFFFDSSCANVQGNPRMCSRLQWYLRRLTMTRGRPTKILLKKQSERLPKTLLTRDSVQSCLNRYAW